MTRREIYEVLRKIAHIDMNLLDEGNRYELNKLEQTKEDAAKLSERLQLGELLDNAIPTNKI